MNEATSPFPENTTAAGPPRSPQLRRIGFLGALVLGLTGVLPGIPAFAAPAAAGTTATVEAGKGHGYGNAHGYGKDAGYGKGHGKGHGEGHGHGHGDGDGKGHGRNVDYVAFGDSYAAGVGGGTALDACGRTAEGYPNLLDALPRVELDSFQACGGATALTTEPAPPAGPVDLPEQISTAVSADLLNRQTDLVTVTISGNDVQFGSIIEACAGPELPETCAPAVAAAQSYAETAVVPQLQASFAAIREAAPRAELVLTGYPHLFEGTVPGALSIEAQTLFNAGTDVLNALLAEQVGEDGTFVDVTEVFTGHGIGSPDSWIVAEGPAALHPTAVGYREGYLPAIVDAVDVLNRSGNGHGHGGGGCRGRG